MATYWENSCSFGLRYVSWYKYLIVSLVFSHLGFWSGNLFLIAPFPDLCLLVPFCALYFQKQQCNENKALLIYRHDRRLAKMMPKVIQSVDIDFAAPLQKSVLHVQASYLVLDLPDLTVSCLQSPSMYSSEHSLTTSENT